MPYFLSETKQLNIVSQSENENACSAPSETANIDLHNTLGPDKNLLLPSINKSDPSISLLVSKAPVSFSERFHLRPV